MILDALVNSDFLWGKWLVSNTVLIVCLLLLLLLLGSSFSISSSSSATLLFLSIQVLRITKSNNKVHAATENVHSVRAPFDGRATAVARWHVDALCPRTHDTTRPILSPHVASSYEWPRPSRCPPRSCVRSTIVKMTETRMKKKNTEKTRAERVDRVKRPKKIASRSYFRRTDSRTYTPRSCASPSPALYRRRRTLGLILISKISPR